MTEREGRGPDGRSAWTDPHFWMPLIIQAVISLIAIVTIVNKTGNDIDNLKGKVDELKGQVTTLQSLAVSTIETKGDIKAIKDRVDKLEIFQSAQTLTFNFNFSTRLAKVEARSGIQTPTPIDK